MDRSDAATAPERLVLFDGVCGFCDRAVQDLLTIDRNRLLRFAPLQGATAAAVLQRHPEIPAHVDSIIYVERDGTGERVAWRSTAALRIADALGMRSSLLSLLHRTPRWINDLAYRVVALVRYRVWGKLDACRVPLAEERDRFLP